MIDGISFEVLFHASVRSRHRPRQYDLEWLDSLSSVGICQWCTGDDRARQGTTGDIDRGRQGRKGVTYWLKCLSWLDLEMLQVKEQKIESEISSLSIINISNNYPA